ncbi:hypothetical protein E4U17_007716 [Claviceps sp. LM77 group G4]|nr:hypothetical protein E4U17_007716 [Claviceps sp. LM77 group G4]
MKRNKRRLEGCGLPLPDSVLGALREMMIHLRQVRDSLRTGQDGYGCCSECASALHDDFVKALDDIGLTELPLDEPFGHLSTKRIMYTRKCNIHAILQPPLERIVDELKGLRLADYQATSSESDSKGGSPTWEETTYSFDF